MGTFLDLSLQIIVTPYYKGVHMRVKESQKIHTVFGTMMCSLEPLPTCMCLYKNLVTGEPKAEESHFLTPCVLGPVKALPLQYRCGTGKLYFHWDCMEVS